MDASGWITCRDVAVILTAGAVHRWNVAECSWTEQSFEVRLQDGQRSVFPWETIRQVAYTPVEGG